MAAQHRSNELALIQTVRALDQTGPGEQGEHLVALWRCLTACSASQFHAAEQNALRWLLKVMSPAKPSPAAELVQRFPTTWRILACIFQRVPLFSLAKALADRRFVAVLRQTLERIGSVDAGAAAEKAKGAELGKRKRGDAPAFAGDELGSAEGALATADAILDALRRLVERMKGGKKEGGHARMGAEHVKSLFSLPATEALALVGPMLALCQRQLASGSTGVEPERWMGTACDIWDLHLQSQGDAVEVATHLARTACVVLRELAGSKEPYAATWTNDLGRFIRNNLVLPSRSEFLIHKATSIFTIAMDVAGGQADIVGTTLHSLAISVYSDLGSASAGDDDWIRSVFRVIEEPLREVKSHGKKAAAVLEMLKAASGLNNAIDTTDLQAVCTRYGFGDVESEWAILKEAANLDQTLFFVGNGEKLLDEVCGRLSSVREAASLQYDVAVGLALAVIRGFCTARNLQAFLKRWYSEMAGSGEDISQSVWFSEQIREGRQSPLVAELEKKLSSQQILAFVDWLRVQEGNPVAQIAVLATLADGLSSEPFVDAIGTRLCDIVAPHLREGKLPSAIAALGWRVVARTASWLTSVETVPLWKGLRRQLCRVLKKTPVQDACAAEAFRCVCQFWASMYPDANGADEVGGEVVAFLGRIERPLLPTGGEDESVAGWRRWQRWKGGKGVAQAGDGFFMDWTLYGPARVVNMLPHAHGKLPDAVEAGLKNGEGQDRLIKAILANQALLDDVSFMRALVDHVVALLSSRQNIEGMLGILSRIPVEAYSREQRRNAMGELIAQGKTSREAASTKAAAAFWKMALGLMVRLMLDRPTFYDGICFQDLVDVADQLGAVSAENQDDADVLSALYVRFARVMIQQSAAYLDESKQQYLADAGRFVERESSAKHGAKDTHYMRLRLLEALLSIPDATLSRSPDPIRDGLQPDKIIAAVVRGLTFYTGAEAGKGSKPSMKKIDPIALHIAIDAAASAQGRFSNDFIESFPARKLEKHADSQLEYGDCGGWKIKAFLIANFPGKIRDKRPTRFGHEAREWPETLPGRKWRSHVGACVDAVLLSLEREEQFVYARDVLGELDTAHAGVGRRRQLFALKHALEKLIELPDGSADRFNFASLHSDLASRLRDISDPTELLKTLDLVHVLLDRKSGFMTQWSVECTLSAVSVICTMATAARAAFPHACRLVETLIRRHRVRLEGHHHMMTTTLQCLLRALLSGPAEPSELHAHMFARLVTMLCVPTAGAVARFHGRRQDDVVLDSATANAKRFAGQYMYVVLMSYVKVLLLDEDVGRQGGVLGKGVREALEPGWHALFDVMPPETRKILNDALDEGGREVVREMWKRYTMFGKWSGV